MSKFQIVALSGTNGAGKDAIGALLAERHNYFFFSLTELLRIDLRSKDLPITRENTRMTSESWRRQYGLGVLVDRSMQTFEEAGGLKKYAGFVMSSLRNPVEADRVHEVGGSVLWIDADPHVRYERIQANAAARGRAGEDNRTFEQFLKDQEDEMHPPKDGDAASLNMAAVKDRADVFLYNDSDSLDDLAHQIATKLELN
jgi:shikimate kinase